MWSTQDNQLYLSRNVDLTSDGGPGLSTNPTTKDTVTGLMNPQEFKFDNKAEDLWPISTYLKVETGSGRSTNVEVKL